MKQHGTDRFAVVNHFLPCKSKKLPKKIKKNNITAQTCSRSRRDDVKKSKLSLDYCAKFNVKKHTFGKNTPIRNNIIK